MRMRAMAYFAIEPTWMIRLPARITASPTQVLQGGNPVCSRLRDCQRLFQVGPEIFSVLKAAG
jgi:hypothetical protein